MGSFFTRLTVHFIFSDLGNHIFSTNFQDSYFYRGIWGIYQRSYPQLFVDKLWICVTLLRITLKYMIKRVFFSYFLYNFGTKMASFIQFLANFGTKTYKNCTKNGIFLLYLWIKRINVALIYNKWYAYLHKLPPIGVYNNQNCIQYSVYNVHKLWFHTISLCVK